MSPRREENPTPRAPGSTMAQRHARRATSTIVAPTVLTIMGGKSTAKLLPVDPRSLGDGDGGGRARALASRRRPRRARPRGGDERHGRGGAPAGLALPRRWM